MERERQHADAEKLRLLSSVVEEAPDGVQITDLSGRIIYSNKAVGRIYGFSPEELYGKHVNEMNADPDFASLQILPAIKDKGQWTGELIVKHKDGRAFPIWLTTSLIRNDGGEPIAMCGIIRDITKRKRAEEELRRHREHLSELVRERTEELTAMNRQLLNEMEERQRLEEQLLHAQKMEAVGRLAGGVAHDFNNRLASIMNYGYLLRMKIKEGDPLRSYVDNILTASQRAEALTKSLLTFSRRQPINRRPLVLNKVVKGLEKLLARVIGEDIELKTSLVQEELIITADEGQLENVLLNLATNARDAMPRGGRLFISAKAAYIDAEFKKAHGYGIPGRYAVISVSDTGAGMDKETRERIFEPFFTTKETGKGTGLGLSVSYGIVKQHDGYINVYSEPGKGTTFKIYLPLIESEVEAEKAESIPLIGGRETVLLAEDDEEVRGGIKDILEQFGYKVIEAVDGQEAVNAYASGKNKIGLVMLDVIMPKMNGKEAFEKIRQINPSAKVIFISGYAADILTEKGLAGEEVEFISKPVSIGELLRKVRFVLDGGRGTSAS